MRSATIQMILGNSTVNCGVRAREPERRHELRR
jgi:hypothetical protein